MDVAQNMELLAELLRCGSECYLWCYDAFGTLLHSNCPDEFFLNEAFDLFGCKQKMLEYAECHNTPVTLGTALGVQWGACFEKTDGRLHHAWVIGPVFYQDVSMEGIKQGLHYYRSIDISIAWTMQLYTVLKQVPVLQNTIFYRELLMLHYCATGEHLSLSDLNVEALLPVPQKDTAKPSPDRHKIWMAEQALLQMVRTGDLNYSQAFSASMGISAGVPVESKDALRQGKTSIIVFTSIVCRAAIEGGLSPEEAYSLGNSYIQSAESAHTISELDVLPRIMYDDFIHRVHKSRANPRLTRQIQQCVDYIEMHLDQKILASDLARQVGYTEYYLTRKFKKETGLSVAGYVRLAKIERAKILLKSTEQTVQEIAEQLGFGTRNYFSYVFQEVTGTTPIEFRES